MSFPVCRHRRTLAPGPRDGGLRWLAAEPYRISFASGALWSIVGVALWPLFYAQKIAYFPNLVHARLMIEAFGGAFVVGFLGTAGPRMASAPKLTPAELLWLLLLHQAGAMLHLGQHHARGDACFAAMTGSLLLFLAVRVAKFRREPPPPQMLLAFTGLACGLAGAGLHLAGAGLRDPQWYRLANLLLYQGFLLPPVLGIGSFVFPRMLGADFGEAATAAQRRTRLLRSLAAALLLAASFFLEAFGWVATGGAVRAVAVAAYLLIEVSWRPRRGGSLTTGLFWSLATGWFGILLAPFHPGQHVSVEHLLYIGGFGLLMLVVGSRVLFGHSGDLEGFFARSWRARLLVFLAVLAATTRATPAWAPSTTVSHHVYAALSWASLALLWLLWHRRRFLRREEEE